MDELRRIGQRTCAIASNFILKYRSSAPNGDFTIWVTEFKSLLPKARARVHYRLPYASITAFSDFPRTSISLTPLAPFSWLTFSVDSSPDSLNPALLVQKSCAFSSQLDATGKVCFTRQGYLPTVSLNVDYRNPYFRLRVCPHFPSGEMRYIVEGTAAISLAYQSLCADMVFERLNGEFTEGAKGTFKNCQIGILSSNEKGEFFFEGKRDPWTVGFHYSQIFLNAQSPGKASSSAQFGVGYTGSRGCVRACLKLPGGVCAKGKTTVHDRWKVALAVTAPTWDVLQSSVSVSIRQDGPAAKVN
jgi:hypothetical protein